jgi:hypothetical protein
MVLSYFPSAASILRWQGRNYPYSAGYPVKRRTHRILQQPPPHGVPQPQPLEHPARGSRGHRRLQERAQPSTLPFSAVLPNPGRVRCGLQVHLHPAGLRHQLNLDQTNPTLETGGPRTGTRHYYPRQHRRPQPAAYGDRAAAIRASDPTSSRPHCSSATPAVWIPLLPRWSTTTSTSASGKPQRSPSSRSAPCPPSTSMSWYQTRI